MLKRFLLLTLACCLFLGSTWSPAPASEPRKLSTGWLDEYEAFLMWLAVDKGWDKEAGLAVNMKLYSSGPAMLDGLSMGEWRFGAMGALPAMLGHLRMGLSVIGNADDESLCNAVLVPPSSPIARVKGWNKKFPPVLGSPETVKGGIFYANVGTSAHYALYSWLGVLGLHTDDIRLRNVDQGQALGALQNGSGGASLWSPLLFTAEESGSVVAATVRDCGKSISVLLVAETGYAEANPETAAAFLEVYLRAVAFVKKQTPESLVPTYQRFCAAFGGRACDEKMALNDLEKHPIFTLEEQLRLFDASSGQSPAQAEQADMAVFYHAAGRISDKELRQAAKVDYVTDAYLKMVNPAKVNP